jgi:hypothetical protein
VEDVTGDLLETVADDPVLSASRTRTAMWYARVAAEYFLRACWVCPAVLIVMLVLNDLSNTFRDASGARSGPDFIGPLVMTVFLFAGLHGGWRTGRAAGGVVAAVATHVLAWGAMTLWWLMTTYPCARVQEANPYWVRAWQRSAAPGETFMRWIAWDNVGAVVLGGTMLLFLATGIGLAGGTAGGQLRRRQNARA